MVASLFEFIKKELNTDFFSLQVFSLFCKKFGFVNLLAKNEQKVDHKTVIAKFYTLCSVQTGTKSFDYWFLATLDERGQSIPTMGIKEGGGRKGYQCDQNYNLIERWFHGDTDG